MMQSVELNDRAGWSGASRALEVLLRSLGTSRAALQIPTESISDENAVGLGKQQGSWQEILLDSVLLHEVGVEKVPEMIVSAETLARALGTNDATELRATLDRARVRTGELTMRIVKITSESVGGSRYLYRLRLEE